MPHSLRAALRATTSALPQGWPLGRRIVKAFAHADLSRDERLVGYFEWIARTARRGLYTDATRDRLDRSRPYDPLLESVQQLDERVHAVNRALYLDARYFLVDHNLNYTDKMAMAHGVEVRVPLLAADLVRFAASLPLDDKLRGSTGKWILREAMRDRLPREILRRSKTGFGVPLRSWIHRELATLVGDVLAPDALRRRGLFDPDAVVGLIRDDRAGRVDAAYPILALTCIELWCRTFCDS
jgi:asparagine synthase (glutamine-hydrolysing)